MKPAPISATRIGRPSASRRRRAVSTMITAPPSIAPIGHPALELVLDLRERRPRGVLLGDLASPAAASSGRGPDRTATGRPRRPACRTRRPDSSSRSRPRAPGSRARSAPGRTARGRCRRELDLDVLQVRRALRAEVDDDVEDRAARAAHELGLGGRRELEVHPAQRALARLLNARFAWAITGSQAVLLELVLAERPREEAAVVLPALEVDDEGAGELGFGEDHRVSPAVGDDGQARTALRQ